MLRSVAHSSLFVILVALALAWLVPGLRAKDAPAPEQTEKEKQNERTRYLRELPNARITVGPIDDPKTTLNEILGFLSARFDISILVNESAFKKENLPEVVNTLVSEKPLDKMANVTFDAVLHQILSRVPATSGATYILRRDHIEITTVAALREEVWGKGHKGPYLPLVHASHDKLLLDLWFKDLAEMTGYNIALDARTGDKGKTAVSATFTNAPLDTALRILADMADLKAVLIDNVFYVTTKENAKVLQEEQDKRKLGKPDRKKTEEEKK